MKKIIYLFLLVFGFHNGAYSVKSLNFYSSTSLLESANLGYAVGENGKISKTTDGGNNWFSLNSITTEDLNSVVLISDLIVFVAGENGTILKTTNGGVTWGIQSSGTNVSLNSIFFLNSNTGFAAGNNGIIRRTTNQGVFWDSLSSNTTQNLNQVYFADINITVAILTIGVIVGNNGTAMIAFNSISSWQQLNVPTSVNLLSVFIDSASRSIFIATEDGEMLKSSNNGSNWSSQKLTDVSLNSISFKSLISPSRVGLAVGDLGKIFRTTNTGTNWTLIGWTPGNINLNSVCLFNEFIGYVAGDNDTLIKTANGGINWFVQDLISVEKIGTEIPNVFSLKQNFPNPFNPETTIEFDIVKTSLAKIIVYNLLGQELLVLHNGKLSPGTYRLKQNFSNYTGGVYYYRLTTEYYTQTKSMILLK